MIQQAITQELTLVYEPQFSDSSFGFRPGRKAHDALKQCKAYADAGYVYVVDMDLEKFFGNVYQSKLVEVLSRSIKDGAVISLIHKYRFFVKFWGAKVSMHSWRGHALNTVRVLFRCVC